MNHRIKELRTSLELSQTEFGKKIGISRSGIMKIESGENKPSEQTIRVICTQFCVNRLWLETGEGPEYMPAAEDDEIIDDVLAGDDEFVKAVIRGIAKTPGGWEAMRQVFNAISAELAKNENEPEE